MADPLGFLGGLISGGLSFFGGQQSRDQSLQIAQQNIALQREFAQNAIQWKVADAAKAGINPLYALGASTTSFSPVSVGDGDGGYGGLGKGLGDAVASLGEDGQDTTRAHHATQTKGERLASAVVARNAIESSSADVDTKKLRNEILYFQLMKLKQQMQPPWPAPGDNSSLEWPGAGGNNTALVNPEPQKVTNTPADRPWMTGGSVADITWARTPTGGYAPMPSKDVKESIEDSPYEWTHFWRTITSAKPPFTAPPGQKWVWNWGSMEYRLERDWGRVSPFFRPRVR